MATLTRDDVASLIQEEYSSAVIDSSIETSTVLNAFTRVTMGAKVTNMPVLATRPTASWVTAENRTKPKSKFSFGNKTLNAEELAVIIVINEEDLEDANEDLLTRAAGLGGEALGRALDQTVIFGTNKPASWLSPALVPAAAAAGQTFQVGADEDDLVGSIFQAAGAVDTSGANPDVFLARNGLRFKLANLRDNQNAPIFLPSLSTTPGAVDNVAGLDAYFNRNNAWDSAAAQAVVADSSAVVIGVRTDVQVKFLDQASYTDDSGNLVSLAESDQVGLRFRARYAYALADIEGGAQPVASILPAADPAV